MADCDLTPDSLSEGLHLLDRMRSHAAEIGGQATIRGETLAAVSLFEQAIQTMNCTQDELLTLWAALECASQAAKKVANGDSARGELIATTG